MKNNLINGICVQECDEEETLLNAVRALYTARGSFYPDKNYGSKIRCTLNMPNEFYALCFARQALYNINGVYVKSVARENGKYDFTLLVNNKERQVQIPS